MSKIRPSTEALLCSSARFISAKARLALLTFLILIGVTWGLWLALLQINTSSLGTRGGSASLCKQASIAFEPGLSVQAMGQLLRSEDAYILYGPDEFGEYQLRFSRNVPAPQAIERLQRQPGVADVIANPVCP